MKTAARRVRFFPTVQVQRDKFPDHDQEKSAEVMIKWFDEETRKLKDEKIYVSRARGEQFQREITASITASS